MRITMLVVALGIAFYPGTASAKDCTLSKEFYLKHPQALAGVLKDPADAILPKVKLELLSGTTVVSKIVTDDNGQYSFGETPAGKYRLRALYNQESFCAPTIKCSDSWLFDPAPSTSQPEDQTCDRLPQGSMSDMAIYHQRPEAVSWWYSLAA